MVHFKYERVTDKDRSNYDISVPKVSDVSYIGHCLSFFMLAKSIDPIK